MPTYREVGARLANVAPTAVVSALADVGAPGEWVAHETRFPAVIGDGVVIREFARVHAGCVRSTTVGEQSLLMSGSYVAHDVVLGRGVQIGRQGGRAAAPEDRSPLRGRAGLCRDP
jgi:acyl-[acyl carrier protein]--UDP-N-acetylglucosamine O-acyltransferase